MAPTLVFFSGLGSCVGEGAAIEIEGKVVLDAAPVL